MLYAEFHEGQLIEAGPYRVSEAEIVDFATRYDPQWFHTDARAAARHRFGGLIASGWHTCSIAMRLVVDHVLAGSESFASPGLERVRWPHPVRPGDELRLQARVLQTRRSRSRPELGILRWQWSLRNTTGAQVLELEATSLFDLAAATGLDA